MASSSHKQGGTDFETRPRVVFDCNLFLQAVGKGGDHAYGCLQLVMDGKLTLYMSEVCLGEINEVLRRPEVRKAFPMLTDERVGELIRLVREVAVFKDPVPHVFDYPTDIKDEPYIDLAIESGGVFLVSWDKHIKNLADENHPEGKRFQSEHPGIFVMDPREFLTDFYS